jgi:SagB-type dehydrogenase family enzyme
MAQPAGSSRRGRETDGVQHNGSPADAAALDYAITGQVVDANSTKELCPWVDSISLRTAGLRYRTLSYTGASRVAEEFLINTRNVRNDHEVEASILHYFEDASAVMLSMADRPNPGSLDSTPLPPDVPLRMELGEAIRRRRSHRLYTGDPLPLDYLATIIRCAAGITGQADADLSSGEQVSLNYRATPSGGRLLPLQLHVASINVSDLKKGVYRYDAAADAIQQTHSAATVEQLLSCVAAPDEVLSVSHANALVLLIGKPWRTMRKYGARGMRFVFMEAGYIAQNIHLAATALGFGTTDCASIYDDEAHEALGIDGLFETLVHVVVVGCK